MSAPAKPTIVQLKVVPSNFYWIVSDTIKWMNNKISQDGWFQFDHRRYTKPLTPKERFTISEDVVKEYSLITYRLITSDGETPPKHNGYFALANDINGFIHSCIKQWVKTFNKDNIHICEAEYSGGDITIKPAYRDTFVFTKIK